MISPRKTMTTALVAMSSFWLPGVCSAEVLDTNISGDAVRVAVDGPLSRFLSGTQGAYDIGGLWGDDRFDQDIFAAHLGLMLTGDAGARRANVEAGLGVRAQFLSGEDDSGGAVELGGRVGVRVPNFNRVGFSAYAWFGPEAASFGDIEDIFEYALSVDYEILRDAAVYVGYRKLEADIGLPRDLEEGGVHGGIRLKF